MSGEMSAQSISQHLAIEGEFASAAVLGEEFAVDVGKLQAEAAVLGQQGLGGVLAESVGGIQPFEQVAQSAAEVAAVVAEGLNDDQLANILDTSLQAIVSNFEGLEEVVSRGKIIESDR